MRYKRISLVNPPLDDDKIKTFDAGYWQPINLLTLASFLQKKNFKGEIQILDQEILGKKKIYDFLLQFQPDLVGLSPNLDSYKQIIEIANFMKKQNVDIVLGGDYSTQLAINILMNRANIDYIIMYDGEIALYDLINGVDLKKINNLVFRDRDKIICNKIEFIKKTNVCDIDYSLINIDDYFKNVHQLKFKRPITIMSQRGCEWKKRSGGCIFCSRTSNMKYDDVNDIWKGIRGLKNRFGIDSIIDVSDDFLGNLDWFRYFYEQRPSDLKEIGLNFIYSRVNHINDETAQILNVLTTSAVLLGLESGDKRILKNTIKGNSISQQLNAIELLDKKEIDVLLCFVLGLPGEDKNSLENTLNHIEFILTKYTNINEIIVSLMTPLPGSRAYKQLINDPIGKKYIFNDVIKLEEIQKDWIKKFCNIDFECIMEYANNIQKLSPNVTIEFLENIVD